MNQVELFFEIVKLFKDEIASLTKSLAEALSNDAADEEAIGFAQMNEQIALAEVERYKAKLQELQAQTDDNQALINAMLEIKNELTQV